MYEKELKSKKEKLLSDLNEYVLTARGYINDSKVQKEVTLKKGKFHVKNATEGSKIQTLSEDEKLILAYEASRSNKNRYDSNMLKNILEIKRRIFLFGSKENVIENIEKEVEEIQKPTRTITKKTKKTFLQIKKEQIQMLKDKETRADGVALLLGIVGFGDDYIETQEEVEHVLSKEEETTLKKLNLLLNLINGGTKKFVEEQLISEIENEIRINEEVRKTLEKELGPKTEPEVKTLEPEQIKIEKPEEIKQKPETTNVKTEIPADSQKPEETKQKPKTIFIPKEEVSEAELENAFDIIAEAAFRKIINTESMDDVIKFLKKNEIEANLENKKYKLIYKKPQGLKGKIDFLKNLKNFYIKQENGYIKPANFTIVDIIMLSDVINSSEFEEKHSKYNDEKDEIIDSKILVDKFFTSMIEAKNRWLEFYHDEEKITKSFKEEIKNLKEKARLLKNNLNELILLKDLINQKELSLEISTGERAKKIIEREQTQLKPALIEELNAEYVETITKETDVKKEQKTNESDNTGKIKIKEDDTQYPKNELKEIAELTTHVQMNKRNIDEFIEFIQNSSQGIQINIKGKIYKLKYDYNLTKNEDNLSEDKRKLKGFVLETENGESSPAYLLITDVIILNHIIKSPIEPTKQKNPKRTTIEITPEKMGEKILSSIIEAKNKLIQNKFDKSLTNFKIEKEIEKLSEVRKELTREQSQLDKEGKQEEKKVVVNKLNQVNILINMKKTAMKIVSEELIKEIRQVQYEKMLPEILEDLIEKYNEACGQVETKEER